MHTSSTVVMAMIAPSSTSPDGDTKASVASNVLTKTTRPIPPQRRSTLKRSIDETTTINTPSSPSKRSRVAFDSDIEIVSADDEDDLDPLVVKEQVRRAIERHRNGNNESYENIRAIFTTPAGERRGPSTRLVRVHLQALLANVASLSKDCSSLVNAVLFSEWIGRDDVFFTLFVKFITNLAAAQRGFQNKIMEMLVELLGHQKTRRVPRLQACTSSQDLPASSSSNPVPHSQCALGSCITRRPHICKAGVRIRFVRGKDALHQELHAACQLCPGIDQRDPCLCPAAAHQA